MSKPATTTKSKSPSKAELQSEVRKLRLENQGYRVYGTPMEIAIKLQYQPPVCYFCCFQITSMENCDIVQIGTDRFWLHHDCLDRGVDLIAAVRHNEIGSLNNSRTIRRLKESATRQRKD